MLTLYHFIPVICLAAYIGAALGYARQFADHPRISAKRARLLLFIGFILHVSFFAIDEVLRLLQKQGFLFDALLVPCFPTTLSVICALAVGVFLILEHRLRLTMLGAVLAPLAAIMMFFSAVLLHLSPDRTPTFENNTLLWLHIVLTVLGHVSFMVAFAISICLILQESLLKRRKFSAMQRRLPSLAVLDRLNARFLRIGFLLMSGGVILGFHFALRSQVAMGVFDSRVLWSAVTLAVYALLLVAMTVRGYRGRRAAWMSVAGFCTVLGSFLGMNIFRSGFHVH